MLQSRMLARALGRQSIPRSLAASGIHPPNTDTFGCRHMTMSKPRRKRRHYHPYVIENKGFKGIDRGGLMKAYTHAQESFDEYLKIASLSPWVPAPDLVAKRMLEIAQVGSGDIHVELGCGDGRVNFHALEMNVEKTIGLDVDENLVGSANDRLARIHPKPEHVTFHVEDLERSDEWLKYLEDATVITMYFVQDALIKLKPKLEAALKNRKCRIVCCGYEMPDWESQWVEQVMDLPIYMYTINTAVDNIYKMSPEERDKLLVEYGLQDKPDETRSILDEPFPKNKWHEVKEVKPPLWDPAEEVDFHWDKFDQPKETDVNGDPVVWWRKYE